MTEPQRENTAALERTVIDLVWPVRAVTFDVYRADPLLFYAVARIVLPSWAWIGCGLLHVRALRQARAVIQQYKATSSIILVKVLQ